MIGPSDSSAIFKELEKKIQKLISLHEQERKANLELLAENRRIQMELGEEKLKVNRMEEGYRNLKEVEKSEQRQSIAQIKQKINDIIGEIDKNISLLNVGNNK